MGFFESLLIIEIADLIHELVLFAVRKSVVDDDDVLFEIAFFEVVDDFVLQFDKLFLGQVLGHVVGRVVHIL